MQIATPIVTPSSCVAPSPSRVVRPENLFISPELPSSFIGIEMLSLLCYVLTSCKPLVCSSFDPERRLSVFSLFSLPNLESQTVVALTAAAAETSLVVVSLVVVALVVIALVVVALVITALVVTALVEVALVEVVVVAVVEAV